MAELRTPEVAGMEVDKQSGLIIPSGTREKVREVWVYQDVKKLNYARKVTDAREVDIILACRKCGKVISFEKGPWGDVHMVCDCKDREIME